MRMSSLCRDANFATLSKNWTPPSKSIASGKGPPSYWPFPKIVNVFSDFISANASPHSTALPDPTRSVSHNVSVSIVTTSDNALANRAPASLSATVVQVISSIFKLLDDLIYSLTPSINKEPCGDCSICKLSILRGRLIINSFAISLDNSSHPLPALKLNSIPSVFVFFDMDSIVALQLSFMPLRHAACSVAYDLEKVLATASFTILYFGSSSGGEAWRSVFSPRI